MYTPPRQGEVNISIMCAQHTNVLLADYVASDGEAADGSPVTPRLYRTAEVAEIFRCSERTIRSWVRSGKLRPIRVGRTVYFKDSELERVLLL